MHVAAVLAADPIDLAGAEVTQRRRFSARQNGSHEEAKSSHLRPPDRIDAAEDHVKASRREPVLDRLARVSEREELRAADYVVLAPRERPNC
jgi:hypothetical protein